MRILLLYFLVVTATFNVEAQISVKDTFNTIVNNADSNSSVLVIIPVANTSSKTINVNWKRTINSLPNNWLGTQVCDLNACYADSVSQGPALSTIYADSFGNFNVTFLNNYNTGTGHVQLQIYSGDSTKTTDIFMVANNTAGIKTVSDGEGIKVYPNPAMDYLLLQNQQNTPIDRVEVYSMLGRRIISQKLNPLEASARIDFSDIPKGIYMVRVFDESNNVVLTKSISHVR